jgi:hypothetical protein
MDSSRTSRVTALMRRSAKVSGVAALELAARGELDLDADVNDQLTTWRLPGPRRVCPRQLLGHTGGLGVPFISERTAVPVRGEWMMLPLLGMARPRTCGLGMFGFGDGRFGHIGGAASFFSVLVASARDGSGAVVMTAANASRLPFRLLRAATARPGRSVARVT